MISEFSLTNARTDFVRYVIKNVNTIRKC